MKMQGLIRNDEYLCLEGLPQAAVTCAISKRCLGNMSLRSGGPEALNYRRLFLSRLGIDHKSLVSAGQVHGSRARYILEKDAGSGAESYATAITETDALFTDKKNLPISILTADCLPIFLYNPDVPAIGIVHAGWRSSKENIVAGTLMQMEKELHARARDFFVSFGPAIKDCCYEVGNEFHRYFDHGLITRGGRDYLDLAAINKYQLLRAGVKAENIHDLKICTSCSNGDFFSHRREGDGCGRMLSVVMLLGGLHA